MLLERSGRDSTTTQPSAYWHDYCQHFEYMMGLDERYYARLRDHTFHFTEDRYQEYLLPQSLSTRGVLEDDFRLLWSSLPEHLHLEEPEESFGLSIGGRIVNRDIRRYQCIIAAMFQNQALDGSQSSSATVLEIGAGYGGFAHQLAKCLGSELRRYIIVDLPEVLLFAAAYLSTHNGPESVYLYDAHNATVVSPSFSDKRIDKARFILVPNYRLDLLDDVNLSMAINIASFQEMTSGQVDEYLAFLVRNLRGQLVSFNRPHNSEANPDQLVDLRSLFGRYFESRVLPAHEIPHFTTKQLFRNRIRFFQVDLLARAAVLGYWRRKHRFSGYELTFATPRS
jgi:putative sugar O-methyltransferase